MLLAAARDHDARALPAECSRDGESNTRAAARHDRGLSFQHARGEHRCKVYRESRQDAICREGQSLSQPRLK